MPAAHSARLRTGRFSERGRPYLVTAATRDRRPLFDDIFLGRLVVHELRAAVDRGAVDSLAWVLMPDHLHWLVTPKSEALPSFMRRVKSRSALRMNRALGISGPIWQSGYHDRALRSEDDLVAVARYVVANPVRAGLVSSVRDWPLWDAAWL